jgi:DNA polymerase
MTVVYPTAAAFLPADRSLESLRAAAAICQGCDLYKNATQTVFGRGPTGVMMALVGEQPGDKEDTEGEPFVGPAGHMLDRALEALALDRHKLYLTNGQALQVDAQRQAPHSPDASRLRGPRLPAWLEAELMRSAQSS